MTTNVLFNEDDYVWGEWGVKTEYSEDVMQTLWVGPFCYHRVGHKKKLQNLEVGKVYTLNNENKFACIYKAKEKYYMVRYSKNGFVEGSTAYSWEETGASISLNIDRKYEVNWSVEPYKMRINE